MMRTLVNLSLERKRLIKKAACAGGRRIVILPKFTDCDFKFRDNRVTVKILDGVSRITICDPVEYTSAAFAVPSKKSVTLIVSRKLTRAAMVVEERILKVLIR